MVHGSEVVRRLQDKTITLQETLTYLATVKSIPLIICAIIRTSIILRSNTGIPVQEVIDIFAGVAQDPRNTTDNDLLLGSVAAWACAALLKMNDEASKTCGRNIYQAFRETLQEQVQRVLNQWDELLESWDSSR